MSLEDTLSEIEGTIAKMSSRVENYLLIRTLANDPVKLAELVLSLVKRVSVLEGYADQIELPTPEELAALAKAQEDGRGGYTYETRGTGYDPPTKPKRRVYKNPCAWCGYAVEDLDSEYHVKCKQVRDNLRRGNEQRSNM